MSALAKFAPRMMASRSGLPGRTGGAIFSQQVRSKTTAATSVWTGTLKEGAGAMSVGTGAFKDLQFSHPSRFGTDDAITNPEEMIGASISGCYSMFLSALLTKKGLTPDTITTTAAVTLGEGPLITGIKVGGGW